MTDALAVWQGITQTPEIVEHFKGLFHTLSITVAETGQAFTVRHLGDRLTLTSGLDPEADFTVPLRLENIERLAAQTRDGRISPGEAWQIAAALFTPLTETTLRNPVMSAGWVRWLAGVEDRIHVHLVNPAGSEVASHTLSFESGRWQVRAGVKGDATRTYRLTPEQSLDYQRQVFAAMQAKSLLGWWRFARWYRRWREAVSVHA